MSQKVRCKFVCESVTNYEKQKRVSLRAVCGNEEENKDFTKYTPSGVIEVTIENEATASTVFEPGKNYYVDFTKVED